ncbi:fluoride efflux transporter CrcB [Bradyrhizobium barranii subsp. apii]|uniref:Fluoride-specific ion channel FluC n=1 Tax=Bradyrhizobium barranii subsp. apii TaxID=2819348 RepID=A0A8T5VB60_9BRAD|nr:fluoride efflux transporter CrcB [Bradyrhizobium barranii]UPT85467.1 fluoride efflux transporter CrcB [Bradyrhizobium barranii subsp. apii]UPT98298.1 fluoride efflux transporter CrcB [Bradyrhizobium barranii subsp. apii]
MAVPSSTDRWRSAMLYAWVSFGSVLGGLARYFVSLVLDTGSGFPVATLFINATGSLIIGFYATLTGPDGRMLARPEHRQFVMTGFCGGYTTFSAFSLETFRLFHGGMKYTALAYVAASVICWLVSVWLGHMMASRYNRLTRS